MKRALWFFVPPLACLVTYWRSLFVWFRIDDFAWLSLGRLNDLGSALFQPAAQGTIRVLSERLYFLVLTGLFGVTSWPFRAAAFGTWFIDLALMQLIGERLTGSRAAGFMAAVFWSVNLVLLTPLSWASAYNQVLIALAILGAFYARLRWIESGQSKWRWVEAILYVLGFGVLETIVVYPALVLLHAWMDAKARPRWRSALWMFIPAAAFGLAHALWIPKAGGATYQMIVDGRLLANLFRYLAWTIGPSRMDPEAPSGDSWFITAAVGVALTAFLAVRLLGKDRRPLFFAGWFVLLLAPVLPLANHVFDYYLLVPGMALAWLAGWAVSSAWRAHRMIRIAGVVLAGGYIAASMVAADAETKWLLNVTSRVRLLVRTVENLGAKFPGKAVVLTGVDQEAFLHSVPHQFETVGVKDVWLAPDSENVIQAGQMDLSKFKVGTEMVLDALAEDRVRVVDFKAIPPLDVTRVYGEILSAQFLAARKGFVDVGRPLYGKLLGDGWFPVENGTRWSGQRASVRVQVPRGAVRLKAKGFAPREAVAEGPVQVRVRADGREAVIRVDAAGPFEVDVPVDEPGYARVEVETSRTFRVAGDTRDLGLVWGTFTAK